MLALYPMIRSLNDDWSRDPRSQPFAQGSFVRARLSVSLFRSFAYDMRCDTTVHAHREIGKKPTTSQPKRHLAATRSSMVALYSAAPEDARL